MGLGWRVAGTLGKRTEGSWYLFVTVLLFGVLWKAHTQTDDWKSVYFWETGNYRLNTGFFYIESVCEAAMGV